MLRPDSRLVFWLESEPESEESQKDSRISRHSEIPADRTFFLPPPEQRGE